MIRIKAAIAALLGRPVITNCTIKGEADISGTRGGVVAGVTFLQPCSCAFGS